MMMRANSTTKGENLCCKKELVLNDVKVRFQISVEMLFSINTVFISPTDRMFIFPTSSVL